MSKKKRRPWARVKPSPELLEWLEERVMTILQAGDRSGPGKAYWTYISTYVADATTPDEWTNLTSYGRGKVLGQTMDKLKALGIVTRKKNFHPFVLVGVLDRIVRELELDEDE